MTTQKVVGSMKLFEDLTIEIVEGDTIKSEELNEPDVLGEISYFMVYDENKRFIPRGTIILPENFPIEVLIGELNHYYANRLFFPDTVRVHDYKSLEFGCFVSEIMVHTYSKPCETCDKQYIIKKCWKNQLKEIETKRYTPNTLASLAQK